jgi:hypothetical protein
MEIQVDDQVIREKKKKAGERMEKSHKILALVNGLGFFSIFFISLGEPSFLIKAGFLIGSLGNILVFIFWNKVKSFALVVLYIFDAVLYSTKGFTAHEHGSRHAFYFFYLVGLAYLVLAIITYFRLGKKKH